MRVNIWFNNAHPQNHLEIESVTKEVDLYDRIVFELKDGSKVTIYVKHVMYIIRQEEQEAS